MASKSRKFGLRLLRTLPGKEGTSLLLPGAQAFYHSGEQVARMPRDHRRQHGMAPCQDGRQPQDLFLWLCCALFHAFDVFSRVCCVAPAISSARFAAQASTKIIALHDIETMLPTTAAKGTSAYAPVGESASSSTRLELCLDRYYLESMSTSSKEGGRGGIPETHFCCRNGRGVQILSVYRKP